jgi:hypothetical protein
MGPCRASGRRDPGVESWSCSLGGVVLLVGRAGVAAVGSGGAVVASLGAGSSVERQGMAQGTGLAPTRTGLGHRPSRFAHRTPVLYSRNQSRTNIVPCKEKRERRGRESLPSCSICSFMFWKGDW